jgi:phenylacetate-coenzyme A ligase PaaK-like adenylate-forming protein
MFFYFIVLYSIHLPYQPQDYFSITGPDDFKRLALSAFRYQYQTNNIYRKFCDYMLVNEGNVNSLEQIPFLPIELFKTHKIIAGNGVEEHIFRSSGTTGTTQSKHYILNADVYKKTLLEGFTRVFGDPAGYSFLALLPGYIERPDSSLIYMVNELMQKSTMEHNQFFIEPNVAFRSAVQYNQAHHIKTILFGVSFSLLRLAEKQPLNLKNIILIETGGMKGQAEEITRQQLHAILKEKLGISQVYSEYGMTELLSQAYSLGNEEFELPPWMQIFIREPNDPKTWMAENKVGGINVIDLANIHSCCFISTQDLGKKTSPNTFEVLGRFDNADIRGCNLLFL